MQDTENQRKTKDKYIIVRLAINEGQYNISSCYPPTRMHSGNIEVTEEAERLAKAYPGIPFAVFKLDGIATVPTTPVQWTTL
jgi:hypothetical protein